MYSVGRVGCTLVVLLVFLVAHTMPHFVGGSGGIFVRRQVYIFGRRQGFRPGQFLAGGKVYIFGRWQGFRVIPGRGLLGGAEDAVCHPLAPLKLLSNHGYHFYSH